MSYLLNIMRYGKAKKHPQGQHCVVRRIRSDVYPISMKTVRLPDITFQNSDFSLIKIKFSWPNKCNISDTVAASSVPLKPRSFLLAIHRDWHVFNTLSLFRIIFSSRRSEKGERGLGAALLRFFSCTIFRTAPQSENERLEKAFSIKWKHRWGYSDLKGFFQPQWY